MTTGKRLGGRAALLATAAVAAACGPSGSAGQRLAGATHALTGQGPVAAITGGPFSGAAPLAVYLDATTSTTTDPNGWIAAFAWNLGDGSTTSDG